MLERKTKKVLIHEIDIVELDGSSLEEMINFFNSYKDPQYNNITIGFYTESGEDGDNPYSMMSIFGIRKETDEEFGKRIEIHAQRDFINYINKKYTGIHKQLIPNIIDDNIVEVESKIQVTEYL